MNTSYLCVHGHFYQPPRHDPFRGGVQAEPEAAPYHDHNEKITAECYQPNAELGNFERMSFDLGPTLASWLGRRAPLTLRAIQRSEHRHREAFGASNALALPYNHTILPLATRTEKRVQVAWGVLDYTHRFGHAPSGMWLPETAVDLETLRVLADAGIRYTILAPWQAAGAIDPTEPYRIDIGDGRSLAAFFYQGALSGSVSFDASVTANADQFSGTVLPASVNQEKRARDEPQILLIATDGELYGHHQAWRDRFLTRLLQESAPAAGFAVTDLDRYLEQHPPRQVTALVPGSAWSCAHGLRRWSEGCACTEGDSSWKQPFRAALDGLAVCLDGLYAQEAGRLLHDPWRALEEYLAVRLRRESFAVFLRRHGRSEALAAARELRRWLELQYYRQLMLTSCGFFFEDLARLEPRHNIAYAARALTLLPRDRCLPLEQEFVAALQAVRSARSGRTGADIYHEVLTAAVAPLPGRDDEAEVA